MTRPLLFALLLASFARAAEPPRRDQDEMREVLRRFLLGMNTCDLKLRDEAKTATDFSGRALGSGPVMGAVFSPGGLQRYCEGNGPKFEIASIVRDITAVTPDSALGDGFFRTIGLPGEERAGRIYVVFVRRDNRWQVMGVRFHALPAAPPSYILVEPAKERSVPGPDGWIPLSLDAFIDVFEPARPERWRMDGDTLRTVAGRGGRSLRTKETFKSFELRFDWKSPPKGNSGVKYRIFYLGSTPGGGSGATGFEYQLTDDDGDPGAIANPVERAGGLYHQIAPSAKVVKPLGEFNESRIVVNGRRVEHWLNGTKVVDYESESATPESPIVLTHHGTDFWYRNIRIRRLD